MMLVLCGYQVYGQNTEVGAVMLKVPSERYINLEFEHQMRQKFIRGDFVRPFSGWTMTFWRTRDYE
jgi:hypothetical protein